MEEEKIVLDRKSFEALAVDSRIRILKSLKERRKTLSEIASEQEMSVSGIKEHLEILEKVGLILKKDDGHKWKYYELTKKGSDIIAPRELRVWILLSMSMIALIASMTAIFYAPAVPLAGNDMMASAPQTANDGSAPRFLVESAPLPDNTSGGVMVGAVAPGSEQKTTASTQPEAFRTPDLTVPFIVAGVSAVTLLGCAGILARNRMKQVPV